MSSKKVFLGLIEKVIVEAEKTKESAQQSGLSWLVTDCEEAIVNMLKLKSDLLDGTLVKSEDAGLGVTRAFSESGVPENLYKAGFELEQFYRCKFNT